ncbi:hypothetical protein PASE110613_09540 [Paenibacillus sediminis]|uniref:Membrane protein YvbJ n=1 Tax=Paenibacillus sediminis TaxID=664909 RepID=A0ABS4H5B7_9BACL|nr:hypothetical protein [Paenibacillus sediminis]MBP1937729.1 putative membrane protein YvbJ [Paenibacillus sediminis]
MSNKLKPPVMQTRKEEVNKKMLYWIGGILFVIVIAITVLLIISPN